MNNLQASLCLLAVTLCWSCEVVIFSVIPGEVSPFATTCITSLIGAALMAACFARGIATAFWRDRWLLVRRVAGLSVINTTYNVLNLVGLEYFDVSTGAFTLSMTVVVLPVMLLVMKRGVGARTWISAGFVLAGIAVAVLPTVSLPQVIGLMVMLASCVIRALFIVKLNDYAREHDPVALAAGMSGLNALIAFIPWCAMQPSTFAALPWSPELVAAYFVYAFFVVGFATVLNTFAQRRATAAQSTIIYSTEIRPVSLLQPVYGIFFGVPGCMAFAVGNLIGDIASDSLRWSSIAGFAGNFAGAYIMYLFWCRLRKEGFGLRSAKALLCMAALVVVSAVVQAIIIAPAVAAFYPDVDIALFTASVLANGTLFPLCFSVPLIVLMQEELGFAPLHERGA